MDHPVGLDCKIVPHAMSRYRIACYGLITWAFTDVPWSSLAMAVFRSEPNPMLCAPPDFNTKLATGVFWLMAGKMY